MRREAGGGKGEKLILCLPERNPPPPVDISIFSLVIARIMLCDDIGVEVFSTKLGFYGNGLFPLLLLSSCSSLMELRSAAALLMFGLFLFFFSATFLSVEC